MSIITDSGFWDSVNGDRRYSGRQILGVLNGLVSDGIVKGYKSSMQVRINSSKLQIRPGRAFVSYGSYEGIWADIASETAITVTAADGYYGRCDAVVLTLNGGARRVTVDYVVGTPSSNYAAYDGWPSSIAANQFIVALVLRNPGTGTTINTTTTTVVDARNKTLYGEGTAAVGIPGIPYASFAGMSSSTYVERQQDASSRVMITNSNGIVTTSGITTTELGRLSGARGNIQDQIDTANANSNGQVIMPFNNTAAAQITLGTTHAGRMLSSYGIAHTFVIPPASSANWTGGTEILFLKYQSYDVTISPGTGVTLYGIDRSGSGSFKITDQFGVACIKKLTGSNDVWVIFGNIEPV